VTRRHDRTVCGRAGSSMPCSRIQWPAQTTSAGLCPAAYKAFLTPILRQPKPSHRAAAAGEFHVCAAPPAFAQYAIGWWAASPNRNSACFFDGARCCRRLALPQRSRFVRRLHAKHRHSGAAPIAFGSLMPRGASLNFCNYSATQVDRTNRRYR
jgi:hypothetical protein